MGYHLGVDLGTTFTAAAVANGQPPTVLGLGNRAMQVPSVLFLQPDGEFLVGEAAERRAAADPTRVAREFKRRIGDHVPILVAGTPHSAQSLTAHLLRWVVDAAAERMGERPSRITVTHPATWGAYRHELLDQIIALADIGDAHTCPEPIAAAVQYAAQTRVPVGAKIAVYDLGGGTFDVCILEKRDDGFAILGSPEGIEQLGGIDFDEALFRKVLRDLGEPAARLDVDDPSTMAALVRLRRDCVEAKESLSADVDTVVPIALPGITTSVRVTRPELEGLIRPSLNETIGAMERALRSAGVSSGDLHAIVLIGGSSRIPLATQMLRAAFDAPTALDTHPKHDIALGAVQVHPHEPDAHAVDAAPPAAGEGAVTVTPSGPPPERLTVNRAEGAAAQVTRATERSVAGPERGSDGVSRGADPLVDSTESSRRSWLAVVLSVVVVCAIVLGAIWFTRRPAATGSAASGSATSAAPVGSWVRRADLPVSLEGAAVAAYQDKIWVAGGLRDDRAHTKLDRVFVFDPATDKWSNGPTLPRPVSHAALVAAGPDLILLGGYVEAGNSADVLKLSDHGQAWTGLAPLPAGRGAGAAAWDGKRVLFAGGTRSDQSAGRGVWSYANGKWDQIGQLKHGRVRLAAVSNGQGQAWFLGGYDQVSGTRYADVDTVVDGHVQYASTASLGTAIDSSAAVYVPGSGKCLVGGQTPTGFNGWWCDNAAYAATLPPLNPVRAGMGAALLGRTIYVVGGRNAQLNGTATFESLVLGGNADSATQGP